MSFLKVVVIKRVFIPLFVWAIPLFLTGCVHTSRSDLSQKNSFIHPLQLDIPLPDHVVLSQTNKHLWEQALVKALQAQTVPAVACPLQKDDWWLDVSIQRNNTSITPFYRIMAPHNKLRAVEEGASIPLTRWLSADAVLFNKMADDAAAKITTALIGIQAENMQKDPTSLKNRPARIYFTGMSLFKTQRRICHDHANKALAQQFILYFQDKRDIFQQSDRYADFIISATAQLAKDSTVNSPHKVGQEIQSLEIIWRVKDKDGKEAGVVTQVHVLQVNSCNQQWNKFVTMVAKEAAFGVKRIIDRYSGRNNKPLVKTHLLKVYTKS